ncbi:uncharacterized protein BCR38DRAFT_421131 [Pseudomassariella vexata]|uniref:Uncharacterized protein n=1 Tax=Pseudomassariella vexata TaxID=1141098 RepID=A0A1Y2EF12_9PEZI|nr:uncharacterized protein BCR38DRAFT_421131 [Pseudomassariella vexata]ORY70150.1 hypothetical protein BCR38DRAFT_421131 [Pseudomassariella vexata]
MVRTITTTRKLTFFWCSFSDFISSGVDLKIKPLSLSLSRHAVRSPRNLQNLNYLETTRPEGHLTFMDAGTLALSFLGRIGNTYATVYVHAHCDFITLAYLFPALLDKVEEGQQLNVATGCWPLGHPLPQAAQYPSWNLWNLSVGAMHIVPLKLSRQPTSM